MCVVVHSLPCFYFVEIMCEQNSVCMCMVLAFSLRNVLVVREGKVRVTPVCAYATLFLSFFLCMRYFVPQFLES